MAQKPNQDEVDKPQHLFRTPSQFNQKLRLGTFEKSPDAYWTRVANGAHKILAEKYRTGQLKMPNRVTKGSSHKFVALIVITVMIAFPSTILYAQYSGQFQAQTQVRSPLVVLKPQFIMPDIWVNHTGNHIETDVFIANTKGQSLTYAFRIFATAHINGSDTQDMTKLFLQFSIAVNDGVRNCTVASLLSQNQVVSFIYSTNSDVSFRLIISYISKPVQLGTLSAPLTISFLYAFSS